MTKDEAVKRAVEYIQATAMEVGELLEVKYVDLAYLDDKVVDCPSDLRETYRSVRKTFRNQWVVSFEIKVEPGRVFCPATRTLCVFETGEVTRLS